MSGVLDACTVSGCSAPAIRHRRTLCRAHDHRRVRYGAPTALAPRTLRPDAQKRTCTRCGEEKALEAFGPLKGGQQGRKSRCRACEAALARERRATETPEQHARRKAVARRSFVKGAYGESGLAADARIQRGEACDVCGARTGRMAIDHDHDTGEVRGILCKNCNLVLGWMEDDPVQLRALAAYLERAR